MSTCLLGVWSCVASQPRRGRSGMSLHRLAQRLAWRNRYFSYWLAAPLLVHCVRGPASPYPHLPSLAELFVLPWTRLSLIRDVKSQIFPAMFWGSAVIEQPSRCAPIQVVA